MPSSILRKGDGGADPETPDGSPGIDSRPRVYIVSDVRLFREGLWSRLLGRRRLQSQRC